METHGNNNDRCYKSYLFSMSKDVIAKLSGCVGNEHASKFLDMILTLRVSLNMLDGSTGYILPFFPIYSNDINHGSMWQS